MPSARTFGDVAQDLDDSQPFNATTETDEVLKEILNATILPRDFVSMVAKPGDGPTEIE